MAAVLVLGLGTWLVIEVVSGLRQGMMHLAHAADQSGDDWLVETVLENHHSKNKIALIKIEGIIMDGEVHHSGRSFVDVIEDQLHRASEDDRVKAVLLKIDSPGGEVLAADQIYRAIREFQKESKKPVIAVMGSLAASGGYYVAAPCRWIVANELTITGSIGVIMHSYNYRSLMDKVGVRPEVYKSGKFKDMLSGDRLEVLPEEKQMMQSMIEETYQRFKTVIAEGRKWAEEQNAGAGAKLAENWVNLADGRIFSGRQAKENGFVDELGDQKTAFQKALEIAGISEANVVSYQPPFEFGSLFRLFGKSEPASIKIDLGLEWPKLRAGRLYLISNHLFGGH